MSADAERLLPYSYVVLRCVPRADREEFLNVGVVLYCQGADFLGCAVLVDRDRLAALSLALDLDAVESALAAVDEVCRGDAATGAAGREPLGTRFGFLSAPRSTVVRPGPIHSGLTAEPTAEVRRLLDTLVRC